MPPEVMERVFEPFFTTKGFGEGTGLGLSQVFGFAKQLGGASRSNPRPGEGATFTHLPCRRASAQRLRRRQSRERRRSRSAGC